MVGLGCGGGAASLEVEMRWDKDCLCHCPFSVLAADSHLGSSQLDINSLKW